jgi:hypothetical protein
MGYVIQHHMPRGIKRTLGEKIVSHIGQMVDLLALANSTLGAERVTFLRKLQTYKRTVEALLRVGHEMRLGRGQVVIATTHWSAAIELLEELGAQCGGWIKSAVNRAPAA